MRRPLVTRIRFEGFGEGNLFALRAQTSPGEVPNFNASMLPG